MFITSVEALIIRIPGHWADPEQSGAYPVHNVPAPNEPRKTALVRITTDGGLIAWGESQSLSTPEIAGAIIQSIVKPALEGQKFGGSGLEIENLWNAMDRRMRNSGQTGGFMLDAMAAVDMALWDLAGRMHGASVASLIAGKAARTEIGACVSCLGGSTAEERLCGADAHYRAGFRRFKIFRDGSQRELLEEFDALAAICGPENIAVDALWRLDPVKAPAFAAELDRRGALWLESPFPPEDAEAHAALASRCKTPVAIGETFRTHEELAPYFRTGAIRILQPDLGRCGITEALRMARAAERAGMQVVPHLSPALGPLAFATLQFAAAVPNCALAPFVPGLAEAVNATTSAPLNIRKGAYAIPAGPGLGLELVEPEVRLLSVA